MGPCAFCGAPAPFVFDAHLTGLRSKGRTIWACADHRAGLPKKQQGGREMDELQEFEDDEIEDMAFAAAAMARHWKAQGLGEHVAAIGRDLTARSCGEKRLDPDLVPSRSVRGVGQPRAVGRDPRTDFLGSGLDEWHQLTRSVQWNERDVGRSTLAPRRDDDRSPGP